jgi:hypothetical protein
MWVVKNIFKGQKQKQINKTEINQIKGKIKKR